MRAWSVPSRCSNLFIGTDSRLPGYRSEMALVVGAKSSKRLPRFVEVVNNTILTGSNASTAMKARSGSAAPTGTAAIRGESGRSANNVMLCSGVAGASASGRAGRSTLKRRRNVSFPRRRPQNAWLPTVSKRTIRRPRASKRTEGEGPVIPLGAYGRDGSVHQHDGHIQNDGVREQHQQPPERLRDHVTTRLLRRKRRA